MMDLISIWKCRAESIFQITKPFYQQLLPRGELWCSITYYFFCVRPFNSLSLSLDVNTNKNEESHFTCIMGTRLPFTFLKTVLRLCVMACPRVCHGLDSSQKLVLSTMCNSRIEGRSSGVVACALFHWVMSHILFTFLMTAHGPLSDMEQGAWSEITRHSFGEKIQLIIKKHARPHFCPFCGSTRILSVSWRAKEENAPWPSLFSLHRRTH